jgi:hypothetical protein
MVKRFQLFRFELKAKKLKTEKKAIKPNRDKAFKAGEVKCSKCGRELKSFHDWINGDNDIILCGRCYQDLLFPLLRHTYMEVFD